MKYLGTLWVVVGCLLLPACAADDKPSAPAKLETEDQKLLYAIGIVAASRLPQIDLNDAEMAVVTAGLQDAMTGTTPRVDMSEMGPKLEGFVRGRVQATAEKEKTESATFLEKAAAEPGVQKNSSGLLYKELSPGSGAQPGPTDTVKVQYRGTLRDGTEFDRSTEPVTFALNGVVPCFSEGLAKMKAGGKSKLVCPASLAYGDRGAPPRIRPGAALVFEIELVEVVPAAPAAGASTP